MIKEDSHYNVSTMNLNIIMVIMLYSFGNLKYSENIINATNYFYISQLGQVRNNKIVTKHIRSYFLVVFNFCCVILECNLNFF